jgi:hypothetical protein
MIHLHEQLWAVIALHRDVEDSEYKLAYMTHREYNKDNTESDKFLNRMSTGRSWSDRFSREPKTKELSFDNKPISGFSIVGSKSRWSTQNKVIQVEDPRGFVVEIPVSALTTLLKHTTVINGIVQEDCLWGREGSNHVLIPINSEIYTKAQKDTYQHNNKVKFSQLKEGNHVKFSVDGTEYVYAGKYKAHWLVNLKESSEEDKTHRWSKGWIRQDSDIVLKSEVVPDGGYKHLFLRIVNGCIDENYPDFRQSGDCIFILDGSYTVELPDNIDMFPPNKLQEYFGEEFGWRGSKAYTTVELHKLEKKEKQ